jgi:HK97 family phage major capsid protein
MREIITEMDALRAKQDAATITADETSRFDALITEGEPLQKEIEVEVKRAKSHTDLRTWAAQAADPAVHATDTATGAPVDPRAFASLGEFVRAVRFPEFRENRDMQMSDGSSGGFWVPEQFRAELLRVAPEAAIVRPRATVIPAGTPPDAKLSMPALDQGTNGVFGGVEVVWIAEGVEKPETNPTLLEVALEPKEVAAHTVVSDKLLRNAPAANGLLTTLLRGAIFASEDYAFLRGNGIGRPEGVLNAAGRIEVARGTATDVKYTDIVNMMAKLLPDSWGSALWVANQTVLPKLLTLVDAGNHSIFIAGDATKAVPATLMGLPLKFTGRTPVLGQKGDLMLLDLRYYLIKDGSGPFVAASEHVYFKNNKTVIKVFWNVDGHGWLAAALTLEDGSTTVSPFVVLK